MAFVRCLTIGSAYDIIVSYLFLEVYKMSVKLNAVEMLPVRFKIASQLRKAILAGEFQEGEELSLTHTASQMGVSRTPVREAFQMLASEGLIELHLNKGAVVKGINIDMIRDHFDLRCVLECEAVARAALSKMDTSGLEDRQSEIEKKEGLFTSDEYRSYNQYFHQTIWEQAANKKLFSTLVTLWNGSSFGKTTPEWDHYIESIREHRSILNSIIKGDPYTARKDMEAHLLRSMRNIIDSYSVGK